MNNSNFRNVTIVELVAILQRSICVWWKCATCKAVHAGLPIAA